MKRVKELEAELEICESEQKVNLLVQDVEFVNLVLEDNDDDTQQMVENEKDFVSQRDGSTDRMEESKDHEVDYNSDRKIQVGLGTDSRGGVEENGDECEGVGKEDYHKLRSLHCESNSSARLFQLDARHTVWEVSRILEKESEKYEEKEREEASSHHNSAILRRPRNVRRYCELCI